MTDHIYAAQKKNKVTRRGNKPDIENKVYKIASFGMILTGLATCFSSVVIGLSLMFIGSIVFSEAIAY